ncbi:hypothetical protein N0V90_010202 [Kalmusia sp. IMI 367209]|nr:hypothetical protein N0V90_010202 [Kalmusia sp. IMI 367209]
MPPIRTRKRLSAEKSRKTIYGRNITRLHIGARERVFTVHEDVLCASSKFFREKVQPNRKEIEGDCSICHEVMVIHSKELTFCTSCGGNFHHECIEDWHVQSPRRCPLCRSTWTQAPREQTLEFPAFEESTFGIYYEWIYHNVIPYSPNDIDFEGYLGFIEAYLFGLHISDISFCQVILGAMLEMFKDLEIFPDVDVIQAAYGDDPPFISTGVQRLRRFLVKTYIACGDYDWIELTEKDEIPYEFLKDFAVAMIEKHPGNDEWDLETVWKEAIDEAPAA